MYLDLWKWECIPYAKQVSKLTILLAFLTLTLGKKKKTRPKPPKPNHNTHAVHTTKHYSSLLGQSFCTALRKMDLCSKWPVKKQRKPNPKGMGNTEARAFLWALAIAPYLFSKMGVNLISSQKKPMDNKMLLKGRYKRHGLKTQYFI